MRVRYDSTLNARSRTLSAALSSLLTTALILIPALPPRPAQAAAGARSLKPADAGAERSAAASPAALAAPLVPSLSATKTDSFPDPDGDGKAEEGDIITYTVTITNNGTDATNVQFSDNVDPNTTLFPGSVSTQPIARGDSYNVLGNVRIQPDASSGLLANDCDPDNGPGCSSAGLTASGPTSSTAGGNVTVNSNGSFSYNPPAGFVGADSFQYTVTDGTGKTDMATASFTVSNMVWFVDNAATAGGDGRLTSPFNSLASVSGASDPDGPGEIIYVLEGSGPYGGGIALEAGQRLVGQGIGLDAALASFGISAPAHSDARPAATGKPVLANAAGDVIVLAGGNLVTFLDASATAAGSSAVSAAGAGSNTLSNVGLSAAGSANGVSAVNVSGSLSVASSTVSATSSGAAVSVSGGSGTIGFSSTAVSQNGGRVVDVQNRTGGSVSFDTSSTVTGTNGATDAVSLLGNSGGSTVTFSGPVHINTTSAGARGLVADSGGSFTLNMTSGANTVSSTGGAAVDIESLAVNIAFATTFSTNSTGRGLRADGVSGTASFGNTAVNSSANTGVLLTGNSAAITFADLDIAPAAGVRALHALDNTGAVSSTSGVIITTGATAVEIDGPASRTPLNVVLTSVSADGTATGILVRDTSDGGNGFRVVGTLTTDGSGGAVTNITNRGADFFNAEDVRLGNMTFTNVGTTNGADPTNPASACGDISPTGGGNAGCAAGVHADTVTNLRLANIDMSGGNQQGVNLLNVTDFLLADSNITNMGDQVREDGLRARNLLGTAEISNTIFSGNKEAQAHIEMVSGTLAGLSVTGSTFSNSTGPVGNHGLRFQAWDGSSSKLSVANSTFSSLFSNGIQALATDTASMEVSVTGSTFTNWGSSAIVLIQDKSANVRFNIANNPSFTRSAASTGTSHVIVVNRLTTSLLGSSIQGAITGNTIGDSTSNTSASVGGSGIDINGLGSGTTTVLVQNNNIRGVANRGMTLNMAESNTGSNRLNATVTGNTVSVTNPTGFEGIFVQAGSLTGNSGILCAEIANNQSSSAATNGLRTRQRFLTTFQLRGYTGANNSNTSVITYLQAQNPSLGDTVTADNSVSTGGGGYVNTPGGAQCAQPVLPSAPLPSLSASLDADALGAPQHEQTAAVKTYSAGGEFTPLRKVRRGLAHSERGQVLGAGLADETAKAAPAAAAVAPAVSGGNVNVNIGTLPAGDSVTITFQVQVSEPFTGSQPQVSNQGTVTADGGVSVQTDDPDDPTSSSDPTVTPILLRPTVNINDATVTEPASGSASASFTVTLSHAYTQPVSVSFATAAGGANPATAGTDYTATSGTVNFAAGETFQTVNVPALADLDAGETDETFLVNLSAATNGTIGDGQATGTITDTSVASPVIISELRTSGPDGSGDDFVELLNTTDSDITVSTSGGWSIVASGSGCSTTPAVVGVIPENAVIPARGNYLLAGPDYSLGAVGAADAALSDIADDRNVGLFTTSDLSNVSSDTRLDAVGFGANTTGTCELLREGSNLPAAMGSTAQHSFVRKVTLGQTHDTGDNSADFVLVSTSAPTAVGAGTPTLGAPGPEGTAGPTGPVPCLAPTGSTLFARDLIEPSAGEDGAPNVVRDALAVGPNASFGTIEFRRKFTNNTGAALTTLRFRVVSLSTAPASAGSADLRALDSSTIVVATAGGPVTVQGTTLGQPTPQASGGGVNSTLAVGSVTTATPIPSGSSVSIRAVFGVEQTGDYDIAFVLESTPGSGKDTWKLAGHTEDGGHTDRGCNRKPVANAGADQSEECSGGQAMVELDGSGSTDPDGDTPLTYDWSEGTTPLGSGEMLSVSLSYGSHTITLTVTDPSGDSSQDTVTVNVIDTTDPDVTAPPGITVNTGPGATSCGVEIPVSDLGEGSATDGCEGSLPVERTGVPSGNFYPVGPTTITYKAVDAAGNEGTATQTVTVIDNTPPVVSPPASIQTTSDPGSCSADVDPGTATAMDNCAVQSISGTRSDNQALEDPYPVGTTTITWKATDVHGNEATATQTVTVTDDQAPTLNSSVAVTTMGPPFNHAMVNVGLSGTATDNCPGTVGMHVSVFSDEDDGAGPHSPDAIDIGIGSLKLRRERDGDLNGRVYLVVVKATDASNNTTVSCNTVTVPLSNSAPSLSSVTAQASAAAAFCSANGGAPPAGYFAVGP